jgi:hypothetical protein
VVNLRRALSGPDAWALAVGLAVTAWFIGTRWLAVFSEAVNWDEFALLARADRSLRLGTVEGGGRPGLVTIALVPFVRGCVDSVAAVVNARLAWQFVTLAYLAGVYAVVRSWIAYSRDRVAGRGEAVLAVALLAFLPAFVTWSVQVRTDQVALAAGTWGCALLISRRVWASLAAGALFAIALLSTQKALYVMAFGGILFLTASISRALSAPGPVRIEAAGAVSRAMLAAAGMTMVIGGYYLVVPSVANLVSESALASSAATMDWYRARLGFRIYTVHAPRLWVHWLLFGILLLWTAAVLRQKRRDAALRIATCWLLLVLGLAVAIVHGSSFAYFVMTAGLFPAVALGLAAGPALARWESRAPLAIAVLVALLAATSVPEALGTMQGSQHRQRETMQLIERTSLRDKRGYQVEGALFCSSDPDPLPAMFTQQILSRRAQGAGAFDGFIAEFRSRPIAYIVESFRMRQFPDKVREFWDEHYVPYAASLRVAGWRVTGSVRESAHEVIVPGTYRWIPGGRFPEAFIQVDGQSLAPGESLHLDAGPHLVSRADGDAEGLLVLTLDSARPGATFPFFDERQWQQLRGYQ